MFRNLWRHVACHKKTRIVVRAFNEFLIQGNRFFKGYIGCRFTGWFSLDIWLVTGIEF